MNNERTLIIQLQGYWHSGGGRSSGNYLDAMCERDGQLPVLPGRQLKGLLRHAVRRAELWGWLQETPLPPGPAGSHEELLFGSLSQQELRNATHPGVIGVGSALIPDPERNWLQQAGNAVFATTLFGELFSTAIDENGSAKAHTLRGTEVAVPLPLHAALVLNLTALDSTRRQQQVGYLEDETPWHVLHAALPLLDHVGAHRNRGLGECVVQLVAGTAGGA